MLSKLIPHDAFSITQLRSLLAIAILFIPLFDLKAVRGLPAAGWWLLIVLGLLGTSVAHTLYVVRLKTLAAKSVSLISCIQPVVAVLFAWLIIQEIPTVPVVIGGSMILFVALVESGSSRQRL